MKLTVPVDPVWAVDGPSNQALKGLVECAKGDGVTTFKISPSACASSATTPGASLAQGGWQRGAPGSLTSALSCPTAASSNMHHSSRSSSCGHLVRPAFYYAYSSEPLPPAMLATFKAPGAAACRPTIPAARTASGPAALQAEGSACLPGAHARSTLNTSNCPGWLSAGALQQLQAGLEGAGTVMYDPLDGIDKIWGIGLPGDDDQDSEHSQDSSDLTDPLLQVDDAATSCTLSAFSRDALHTLHTGMAERQGSAPSGPWPASALPPHLLLRKTMSAAQLMMGGSPREAAVGSGCNGRSFGEVQPGGMELSRLRSWLSLTGLEPPCVEGATAGSGCSSGNGSCGTAFAPDHNRSVGSGINRRGSCSPRHAASNLGGRRGSSIPSRQNSSRLVTSEADGPVDAEVAKNRSCGNVGSRLTAEERAAKIQRYRDKRSRRYFGKRGVQYQCRKSLADTRPRVRGRFARDTDANIVLPHQTKKAKRMAAAAAAAAAQQVGAAARQLQGGFAPDAAAAAAAWAAGCGAQAQQQMLQQAASLPLAAVAGRTFPAAAAAQQQGGPLNSSPAAANANTSPSTPVAMQCWDAAQPLATQQQHPNGTTHSTGNSAPLAQRPALTIVVPNKLPRPPLVMPQLQVPAPPAEPPQGVLHSDLLPQLPTSMTAQHSRADAEVTEVDARLAAAFLGWESPGSFAFAGLTPGSMPMLLSGLPSNTSDLGDGMQLDLAGLTLPCGGLVGAAGGHADMLLASLGVPFDL